MFQQKPKKNTGRFIGKTDPLRSVVAISDFELKEIAETSAMIPDNLAGTIFHRSLHSASDEEMGVLGAGTVLQDFSGEGKRPVLEPLDFTEDWKRQRQRLSSKRRDAEDDEDFDLYGEAYGVALGQDAAAKTAEDDQEEAEATREGTENRKDENFFKIQRESVDEAAKVLQTIHESEGVDEEEGESPPSSPEMSLEEETAEAELPPAQVQPRTEEKAFVPMRVNLGSDTPSTAEMDAVRSYQTQLIDREKIIEEAKAEGYQEGFRLGEEKAALQARRQIQELASTLAPLIAELDGLKKNILVNAQENFQTLCQALMEAVMRREFEVNPGAFAALVERAIQDTVPDDSFRVHVHPELLESASRHFPDKIRARLAPDKNLPKGDFRVESQLTVVDGNVTQVIRDLLDQADLALFQTKGQQSKGKAS